MPVVTNAVVIQGISLKEAWEAVCDFERYPLLMRDVLEVTYIERNDSFARSAWRILLNGSEMSWVEKDSFRPMTSIEFTQEEGDLEVFRGRWDLVEMDASVRVDLTVEFDIGVPSMAHVLDPIGIQAVRSNSRQMLQALAARYGADFL